MLRSFEVRRSPSHATGSAQAKRWRRLPALVATVPALALLVLIAAPSAAAQDGPWTFDYTGGPQTFTVPAGVEKLSMVVVGGAGGQSSSNLGGAPGGVSGMAYGRFSVTPGEELTIWVGEGGRSHTGPTGIAWGFGCGAAGGPGEGFSSENGGGGGASSAVTRGTASVLAGDCVTRPEEGQVLAVGGGGGGGGANNFIPPSEDESGISPGGTGGDGGFPAGRGATGGVIAPGGCGGCEPWFHGQAGVPNPANGGGGGGGGGGFRGGGGGGTALEDGGAGGGGGSSYVTAGAERSGYLAGYGSGSGSVTLSALGTEVFQCTGGPQDTTVPVGAGQMEIEAAGGHGGSRGSGLGGEGGRAGTTSATLPVTAGEDVDVFVGCAGTRDPGWGYGIGGANGQAPAAHALDGASGGGSSGVEVGGRLALIAAGGGGGGGSGASFGSNTDGSGGAGGNGGDGGLPGKNGAHGEPDYYPGGNGGEGQCCSVLFGGHGGNAGHGSLGGGGGGGGAGWYSGAGGHEGRLSPSLDGGGGGGGGGGMSGIFEGATAYSYGTSDLAGSGLVELTYLPAPPAAIGAYGGSKQQATIGSRFSHPLAALVTDAAAKPVANASVVFTLPASGASGSFAGGGTSETVATGTNGVAISPPVTANVTAGAWQATASVAPVSSPARFSLTNAASETATHVTASPDPATPTEPVAFTAKVTAATPSAGIPSGTLQFKVDGTDLGGPVALSDGGAASVPTSGLTPGPHTIEAVYEGTAAFLPSSGSLSLPVEKTPTATHVTSSLNPALPTESIAFTADIAVPAGNTPYSGAVQFTVDGTPLGAPQAATNGTATSPPFETAVVGAHAVVATTAETADYLGSDGSLTEVVDPDGTAVQVGSSANPAEYGAALELAAEVLPRPPVTLTPTGTVDFTVGGDGCSGTLSGGTTSCAPAPPALPPGRHEVSAHYGGDADYEASDGSMVQRIVKARTATTVAASPESPSVYGEPVAFDAEVARTSAGTGTPTGTVQFALDGTAIGSPVPVGPAGATSPPLTPDAGAHVVTAAYSGDGDFSASTGTAPYRVLAAPTTVVLSASPEPSQPGEGVAFSAEVEAGEGESAGESGLVPDGQVQFRVDGLDFEGPVPLEDGEAVSAPYEDFEPGRHDVSAIYLPADQDFEPSHARIVHEVDQPTITVVASSKNPSPAGAAVTVAAHVGPLATAGTISFQVDGSPVPTCQGLPLHDSDATCTVTGLIPGEHDVRAVYSGAPLFDSSQGSLVQQVEAPPIVPVLPLEECKLRDVRGRLLVYRSRDAVRLVARYRAAAAGRVAIRFYARKRRGSEGRRLGTLTHTFPKQGRARLAKRMPARLMKRLRRQRRGFVVHFAVSGDPGYCARAFSKELSIRRKVADQLVWFQSDSARDALPPNSR